MAIGYGRENNFNYTPEPDSGTFQFSSFYDYARLSEFKKLYLSHKCVIVNQYQVGQPTDSSGYIPMDLTTGVCSATITDSRDDELDLDVPGRTGGQIISFDNSLTMEGDGTNYRSAAMDATLVAPDATIGVAATSVLSYSNIRESDRGDSIDVDLVLIPAASNVSLLENLSNLVSVDGTFAYSTDGGSTWNTITGSRRWDGATTFSFTITMPSSSTGELRIRSTFGSNAVAGTYTWEVTMTGEDSLGNDRKLFTESDSFVVS